MWTERITYTDYDGNERTENCQFNLSKSELMKMEIGKSGGYEAYVQRIIDAQDGKTIMDTFEELILGAYGVKSPDGKIFQKSPEISKAFSQTGAYDALFMKLVTDAAYGAKFVAHIIPDDLRKAVEAEQAKQDAATTAPQLEVVQPTN